MKNHLKNTKEFMSEVVDMAFIELTACIIISISLFCLGYWYGRDKENRIFTSIVHEFLKEKCPELIIDFKRCLEEKYK